MPLLRPFAATVRTVGSVALACLALHLGFSEPAAAQQDLYEIGDVEVDATATSAVEARERALAEGQREAFQRLLDRLTLRGGSSGAQIPNERIVNLVRDFEVQSERTSSVRYLAELTFRFDPEGVRQLLREEEIDFAEARSQPLVVLPVLTASAGSVLWEDPNPWRAAWARSQLDPSLVPLIVPLGDLSDISAAGAEEALSGDAEALRALAGNYDTTGVLVAEARLTGEPEAGGAAVSLHATRYLEGEPEGQVGANLSQRSEETAEDFFQRAVAAIDVAVQEDWKEANLLDLEDRRELRVSVRLDTLGDLTALERHFAEISTVERSTLRYLARREAQFDLAYFGDPERLRAAFAQRNLTLLEPEGPSAELPGGPELEQDEVWELLLPGRNGGDRAPRVESDPLAAPENLTGATPAARPGGGDAANGTERDGGPTFGGPQSAAPGEREPASPAE